MHVARLEGRGSMTKGTLRVVPLGRDEANELVRAFHRHHGPVVGYKFAIGLKQGEELVGAAIVGRPVARHNDDGLTAEVTRVVVKDGIKNGCSMLYGACRRAAFGMGYKRVLTYTLQSEPGVSLRAAGWVQTAVTGGGSWSRPSRARFDAHPLEPKTRWEAVA